MHVKQTGTVSLIAAGFFAMASVPSIASADALSNLRNNGKVTVTASSSAPARTNASILSSAPAQQQQQQQRPGLRARIANAFRGMGQRVQRAVNPTNHPKNHEPGFIPRHVLEEIIAKTPTSGPGMSATQIRKNIAIVNAAKHTLAVTPKTVKLVQINRSDRALDRWVGDSNFKSEMPVNPARKEGDPASKVDAVNRAWQQAEIFAALNKEIGFNAMDAAPAGAPLRIIVQYNQMENAYYDGRQMVDGGGGALMHPLDRDRTVNPHEIGHAMTANVLTKPGASLKHLQDAGLMSRWQRYGERLKMAFGRGVRDLRSRTTALVGGRDRDLNYRGESGALNESVSDIYAAMAVHFEDKKPIAKLKETDWLIGGSIWKDMKNASGGPVALRNMTGLHIAYDDPRGYKDNSRFHIKDKYTGGNDNGGVHINSGIPNRAFYEATTHYGKANPGTFSWKTTGYVWMHALSQLGPNATFQEAANATFKQAQKMFGNDPKMAEAIAFGWKQVGLEVKGAKRAPELNSHLAPKPSVAAEYSFTSSSGRGRTGGALAY